MLCTPQADIPRWTVFFFSFSAWGKWKTTLASKVAATVFKLALAYFTVFTINHHHTSFPPKDLAQHPAAHSITLSLYLTDSYRFYRAAAKRVPLSGAGFTGDKKERLCFTHHRNKSAIKTHPVNYSTEVFGCFTCYIKRLSSCWM